MSPTQQRRALLVAGAVCWALAIYGYSILGLAGGAAWVAAAGLRRPPR